jgi:hypothetical protein
MSELPTNNRTNGPMAKYLEIRQFSLDKAFSLLNFWESLHFIYIQKGNINPSDYFINQCTKTERGTTVRGMYHIVEF